MIVDKNADNFLKIDQIKANKQTDQDRKSIFSID